MSVSCNNIPTGTSVVEITTDSLSTTSSAVVTTEPGTTITSTTTIPCTPIVSGSVTATCTPIISTTVITSPGSTHTTFVPVTVTVPVTTTSATTLWGSSCTTIPTAKNTDNNNNNNTPTPTPTPTPVVVSTTSSSTQPNGSVVTVVVTSTSLPASSATGSVQNSNNDGGSSSNIGPIVGGAVGGFFGLIAIVGLIWFFLKRRQRWDDIWETDEEIAASLPPSNNKPRRDMLETEVEPKPYEYGLVGRAQPPPPSSPPQSPPFGPTRPEHGRTPSMAPLLTPMSAAQTLGSTATVSSRPSTGGSTYPLNPSPNQLQPQIQQQPQLLQQAAIPPPQRPDLAHASSSSMTHAHTISNSSINSPPVSLLNWSGNPGPAFNEAIARPVSGTSFAAAVAGPSNASGSRTVSPPTLPMNIDRVGSPMSVLEQRRLHVTNAPAPQSPQSAEFDPYAMDSAIAAASAAATTVIPASVPQLDRKGRLAMPAGGSKTPIVHLDGGRVQDALNIGRSATAGPSPPAYEA